MRTRALLLGLTLLLPPGPSGKRVGRELPAALPNDNTAPAGRLRDGVLRIALDARLATWHPDGDSLPGIPIEVFAEAGRPPQVPGPLIRVPAGTEIQASVRNSLERDTLTFFFPAMSGPWSGAADSLVIPPGDTRELRARADTPGDFLYRAVTSTPSARKLRLGGLLGGAVIVDSTASPATPRPRDRVFVILIATDSVEPLQGFPIPDRAVFSINGRSWPHTERLHATLGDTVRWRVINASFDVHPMHLHGHYYRVDEFGGPSAARDGQTAPGRMVVTERMSPFSTMRLTWVAEREGHWLFHCHFQIHVEPHGPLGLVRLDGATYRIGPRVRNTDHDIHANHALTGMAGLVLGVEVRPRRGKPAPLSDPVPGRRRLRLVAVSDSGFPDSAPSMRFVLEDPAAGRRLESGPGSSPPIELTRGQPVSLMVVNHLREPTAVHWHGIELESYFDGVAGFSGSGGQLAPVIAPLDSFEARFTPPRAGTFIYHSHVDEQRQHRAGLVGALIVRDAVPRDSMEDLIFMIKSARAGLDAPVPLEINGRGGPDTTVLHVGRRYRLRFVSMPVRFPNAVVSLTGRPDSAFTVLRDTMVLQWTQLARDGADLPAGAAAPARARQIVSIGETYDFEFVPSRPGSLRLEIRTPAPPGRLLVRVPIRVE